jgi:hypothetical protein
MLEIIPDALLPPCCSYLLFSIGIEVSQGLDPDLLPSLRGMPTRRQDPSLTDAELSLGL